MTDSNDSGPNERKSVRELTLSAREAVEELTGFPPESVSGLARDDDRWFVTVDVCELERIPSTTDVLATYVVELDDGGELLGFKRTRRFQRAQAEES
jgi:hypothetical protein